MKKINLDEILQAIEFQTDESLAVINKKTGEVYMITEEAIMYVEGDSESDCPEWIAELVEQAKNYYENEDDFVNLPSKYEVGEYDMMQEFAESLPDKLQRHNLLLALQGKGAFRRFKDTLIRFDIEKKWYDYRELEFIDIALEWCRFEGLKIELNESQKRLIKLIKDNESRFESIEFI